MSRGGKCPVAQPSPPSLTVRLSACPSASTSLSLSVCVCVCAVRGFCVDASCTYRFFCFAVVCSLLGSAAV